MPTASTEIVDADKERFDAAVKIITSLPKDGAFQPSNDMKLKFYGYFKQATIGPCTDPKPSFWDVVKKAKWEAWHSLGKMPKQEAMRNYVDSLNQIVETMTLDANVQDFIKKGGPTFEFVDKEGVTLAVTGSDGKAQIASSKGASASGSDEEYEKISPVPNGHANGSKNSEQSFPQGLASEISLLYGGLPNFQLNGNNNMENTALEARERVTAKERRSRARAERACEDRAQMTDDVLCIEASNGDVQSDEEMFADASESLRPVTSKSDLNDDNNRADGVGACADSGVAPSATEDEEASSLSDENREPFRVDGRQTKRRKVFGLSEKSQLLTVTPADALDGAFDAADPIRDLTDIPQPYDQVFTAAWDAVERLQRERRRRLLSDSQHNEHRFFFSGSNKHHKGKRKARGRGETTGETSNGRGQTGVPQQEQNQPSGSSSMESSAVMARASGVLYQRSRREPSGSDESQSSGNQSPEIGWDPHVAAVLFRMHRELQQISRQMDLMETILVTQQRLLTTTLAESIRARQPRLWFFTNLPWRTVGFIIFWPIVVQFLLRLVWRRLQLRRRQ